MIHTDRGVEYRGKVYQNGLKRNGMVHSLNRAVSVQTMLIWNPSFIL
jgi:transposase InsO family protein